MNQRNIEIDIESLIKNKKIKHYNWKEILRAFSSGKSISEIVSIIGLKDKEIYAIAKRMKEYGLIDSTKVRQITKKGFLYVEKFEMLLPSIENKNFSQDDIRLHKIEFMIEVKNKPYNWDERRQGIAKYKQYHEWDSNGNHFNEGYYEDIRIRTDNKNVYVYLKEIFGRTSEIVINKALDILYSILPIIEGDLKIKLEKPRRWNVWISDQHLALVDNSLAKFCNDKNIELKIYDEGGKVRAQVDKSKGVNELEFQHKTKASSDSEKFQEYCKDILEIKPMLPSQLSFAVDFLYCKVSEITELMATQTKLQINTFKMIRPETQFTHKDISSQDKREISYIG